MALSANDFVSGSLTGIVTVRNGFANISLSTIPRILEGNKSFVVRLRRNAADGPVITETPAITIQDNSEFVSLTPNVTTFSEGDSVQFTLLTANAANNATLYFSTLSTGGNINSQDFFTSNSGTFVVVDNAANIVLTANTDFFAIDEGNDQFKLQIRTQGTEGNIVIVSNDTVQIQDTSNTFRLESIIASTVGPIVESESLSITVNTVNGYGNSAATYYYTVTGNADIYSPITGEIVVNDNYGQVDIIAESSIPDSEEREFTVQVRTDSIAGDVIFESNNIIVNSDIGGVTSPKISRITEVNSNTNILTPSQNGVSFDILIAAGTDGETLYYKTVGNVDVNTFVGGNTGSLNFYNNTATLLLVSNASAEEKVFYLDITRPETGNSLGFSNSIIIEPGFFASASGGTTYTSDGFTYHKFTTTSNLTLSPSPSTYLSNMEILVIGGGGGGAGPNPGYGGAGGAGAGGMTHGPLENLVSTNSILSISIGAGGARQPATSNGFTGTPTTVTSPNGLSLVAYGGASALAGGSGSQSGGCGGGGSGMNPNPGGAATQPTTGAANNPPTFVHYGFPGGTSIFRGPVPGNNRGGGGGGTGSRGGDTPNDNGGNGGLGSNVYSSWATITSSGVGGSYAGGGGGAGRANNPSVGGTGGTGGGGNASSDATQNTGSGGGGGHQGGVGGAGGSGLVIVKYKTNNV